MEMGGGQAKKGQNHNLLIEYKWKCVGKFCPNRNLTIFNPFQALLLTTLRPPRDRVTHFIPIQV